MIIKIKYHGGGDDPVVYEGVELTFDDGLGHTFYGGGGVVADFDAAMSIAEGDLAETGESIMFSSSVDHFLVDSNYVWDEDTGRIVAPSQGVANDLDQFIDSLEMDDLDDSLHGPQSVMEAFENLRRAHGRVVEENAVLHDMLRCLTIEERGVPVEEIKKRYREITKLDEHDTVLAPITLMALELIEAMCVPSVIAGDPRMLLEHCFRYAHVALAHCEEHHDDWIEELIENHRRAYGDGPS